MKVIIRTIQMLAMKKVRKLLAMTVLLVVTTGWAQTPTPTPGCSDAWGATSTTDAPTGRSSYTAVWTGSEMIVWGGIGSGSTNLTPAGDTTVTNT